MEKQIKDLVKGDVVKTDNIGIQVVRSIRAVFNPIIKRNQAYIRFQSGNYSYADPEETVILEEQGK